MQYVDEYYSDWTKFYTDGTHDPTNGKTEIAIYIQNEAEINQTITDDMSAFTAEMLALLTGLVYTSKNNPTKEQLLNSN